MIDAPQDRQPGRPAVGGSISRLFLFDARRGPVGGGDRVAALPFRRPYAATVQFGNRAATTTTEK